VKGLDMATNYLEQLVAEWYEHKGYFIRRNVNVGKRKKGGFECELDIVGFHPTKKHLVQVEPSVDASSWAERERRYRKKFEAGRKYIPSLFEGFTLPEEIEQIAVFAYASKKTHETLAGGKIVLMTDLLEEIFNELRSRSILSSSIPEQQPILRTLQIVAHYRKNFCRILCDGEI
jgi:hypothetical protein